MIFEGAGIKEDEPARTRRHRGSKMNNNKEEQRLAESQGKIEDQERSQTSWKSRRPLQMQRPCADAPDGGP